MYNPKRFAMNGTVTRDTPLVLYVDDENTNLIVFEQSLGSLFAVRCVDSAKTALEVMANAEVAVLITDMRMPTMNGEELLRIAKERHPQTIRMVITAYSDIDPILRAMNEGLVVRYMLKPWHREELVQVLRWALEAYRFSRDSAELHRRLLETERLATLGSLSAMLVHDLKQPLMSLMYNIEVLRELSQHTDVLREGVVASALEMPQRGRVLGLVEDLQPIAEDLHASTQHLSAMIANLRELGKPRGDGGMTEADPLPIVRHAMSVCQELAIKVGASIGYRGPTVLPRVKMSPTELTQVLINIIANGAQAVGARGTQHGSVSVVARPEHSMLELEIRDDGVGIPKEVLERVGTPFFTTRKDGTGLGLAQCQRLVGTAGGRLRIESEVGVGTTVTILLPIAA